MPKRKIRDGDDFQFFPFPIIPHDDSQSQALSRGLELEPSRPLGPVLL